MQNNAVQRCLSNNLHCDTSAIGRLFGDWVLQPAVLDLFTTKYTWLYSRYEFIRWNIFLITEAIIYAACIVGRGRSKRRGQRSNREPVINEEPVPASEPLIP